MSDYIVNEGSTATVILTFKDENDQNITPDSIVWRLDDATLVDTEGSGQIVGDTTEIPTSYKHTITIPNTANGIIDEKNSYEEKILTVAFYYSTNKVGTDELRYQVKNLAEIPLPF